MKIVVIAESAFGNTRAVADRLAKGARAAGASVEVLDAAGAPRTLPDGTDLLVVAAPTHNGGLPRDKSRAEAQRRGGTDVGRGVREWIADADVASGVAVACVSTVSALSGFAGSAGRAAAKALSARGFARGAVTDFLVQGNPPVLADGEAERAEATGRALATGSPLPPPPAASEGAGTGGAASAGARTRRPPWRRWWFWLTLVLVAALAASVWVLLTPNPNVGDRGKLAAPLTPVQQAQADRVTVSRAELAAADGSAGRAWVAVNGVVYDLSAVKPWAEGRHHGIQAGVDETDKFVTSGHAATVLAALPVVGRLAP